MYQKTVTLYQHTPLIHFQGEQTGATLRATDIKPRLDRWIITKFGHDVMQTAREQDSELHWSERNRYLAGWNLLSSEKPNWLALSDQREERQKSLNYQIRITSGLPNPLNRSIVKYPTYFAEVGREDAERTPLVSFYHSVQLIIQSADETLLDYISKEANDFFYATNFGTRASKGFGSFSPAAKPEGWTFKFKIPHPNPQDLAYPDQPGNKKGENDLYQRLFRHIDFFYRSLRAGINCFTEPEKTYDKQGKRRIKEEYNDHFYMKPLIFQYAMDKGITWEKKLYKARGSTNYTGKGNLARYDDIRASLPNDGFALDPQKSENRWPKWYDSQNALADPVAVTEATVRDALGLSTDQSWKDWEFNGSKMKINKSSATSGPKAIARAPSPFTFVPVREKYAFAVYVYARQPEDYYLTHEYEINVLPSAIPVFPDFDMAEFLDDYLAVPTLERSVVIKDKTIEERNEDPLFLLLEGFYAQARGSLNLDNIAQP